MDEKPKTEYTFDEGLKLVRYFTCDNCGEWVSEWVVVVENERGNLICDDCLYEMSDE